MNTIQPFSVRNVNFCQKPKKKQLNDNVFHSKKMIEREKNWSFFAGALCTAAVMYSMYQYNNSQQEFMLEEIATELKYSDPEKTQIKIIDGTGDDVPDFIIENKYGAQSIYDIKNDHKYYKDKLEFEKIY